MKDLEERSNSNPGLEIRTSFFTRKLANKLNQKGSPIPQPVMVFLDTPLCSFGEDQRNYFDQKFCPLIPTIISILEEVFEDLGADREGWEDMLTYSGDADTPIKICARAVAVRKEKEAADEFALTPGREQRTKKIQLPPQFDHLNPSMC